MIIECTTGKDFRNRLVSDRDIKHYIAITGFNYSLAVECALKQAARVLNLTQSPSDKLRSCAYEAIREVAFKWTAGIAGEVMHQILHGGVDWHQPTTKKVTESGLAGCFWGHFDDQLRREIAAVTSNTIPYDLTADFLYSDNALSIMCNISIDSFYSMYAGSNSLGELCYAYNEAFPLNIPAHVYGFDREGRDLLIRGR
jgi:hypothetical protein